MNTPEEKKGRLQKPHWKILSILGAVGTVSLVLYTLLEEFWIIPITAVVAFTILWYQPWAWATLEEVFGKRPTTKWGRLSLNLVLAMLAASVFEDVFELFRHFLSFIFRLIFS